MQRIRQVMQSSTVGGWHHDSGRRQQHPHSAQQLPQGSLYHEHAIHTAHPAQPSPAQPSPVPPPSARTAPAWVCSQTPHPSPGTGGAASGSRPQEPGWSPACSSQTADAEADAEAQGRCMGRAR
jgi:hypothetical protein